MSARAFYGGSGSYAPQLPTDRGYKAWSMPPFAASVGTALATAGTLYLTRIRRVPAGPVTNIVVFVSTGGTSLTAGQCFASLFTAAGVLLGTTADQATAWGSAGIKTMALSGGAITHGGGDLYAGMWFNGTTGPAMYRGANGSGTLNNVGLSAPNMETATANTGLTTTPPNPFGTQSTGALHYWVALS